MLRRHRRRKNFNILMTSSRFSSHTRESGEEKENKLLLQRKPASPSDLFYHYYYAFRVLICLLMIRLECAKASESLALLLRVETRRRATNGSCPLYGNHNTPIEEVMNDSLLCMTIDSEPRRGTYQRWFYIEYERSVSFS